MRYLRFELFIFALLLVCGGAITGSGGHAAAVEHRQDAGFQLVMVEELGCTYCDLWNEEIGETYAKTAEGRFAPLTRVFRGDPVVKNISRLNYTPTFIVLKGDKEIGRIVGYPGEEFFWSFLSDILGKAGFKPSS